MKSLFLFFITITLCLFNVLNAQNPCPSFNYCIIKQTTIHDCYSTPNSPSCVFEYKVCFGEINGVPSIFIDYFIIDQNCPCEEMMRHYLLKEVFEKPEILSYFNITQPNQEYIYDLYVANCARKVLHQGNYGTNGQFTYPGWKIINCEDQECCKHTYKVVYRYNCNANPQCLKLDWYNKENTSAYSENCNTPCFPNCHNWTGYSGPPMDKVNSIVNFDLIIDYNNVRQLGIEEQIKGINLDNQINLLKIYDLNGNLLLESILNKKTEIKELLRNNKISSNVYIYEVIDANKIKIKGKLLIK